MKKITPLQIEEIAKEFGLTVPQVKSVSEVEGSGQGFDDETGKLLIQFEPVWFKRKAPFTPSGKWSVNKVEVQAKEWIAFNDAFKNDPDAAMESTSIGMMQVMGFHWRLLGFDSVGAMWDYAKVSEANQLRLGLMFIKSNRTMYKALKNGIWWQFAYYYNGEEYKKYKYDSRLKKAFDKHNRPSLNT
jgi:hypothetical protein